MDRLWKREWSVYFGVRLNVLGDSVYRVEDGIGDDFVHHVSNCISFVACYQASNLQHSLVV